MQQISSSITNLAKALARAQAELEDPLARHPGQIRKTIASGTSLLEAYRYASLSDGVALLRPILGRHGLSIIQATRIDAAAGLLVLETRLLHETGEWLGADYPVVPLAEVKGDPRSVGASLTYARRQCLFALVGLVPQPDSDGVIGSEATSGGKESETAEGAAIAALPTGKKAPLGTVLPAPSPGVPAGTAPPHCPPVLLADRSRALAATLAAELAGLACPEARQRWARHRIADLKTLRPEHRAGLNQLFKSRDGSVPIHNLPSAVAQDAKVCATADPRAVLITSPQMQPAAAPDQDRLSPNQSRRRIARGPKRAAEQGSSS